MEREHDGHTPKPTAFIQEIDNASLGMVGKVFLALRRWLG